MSQLRIILIDVGWGDSILLESVDSTGETHFALVDSNDTANLRSSFIFLKRRLERFEEHTPLPDPVFEWVLMTHAHADHAQGLKATLKEFTTDRLYYPKVNSNKLFFSDLLRFANRSSKVGFHQSIDNTKQDFQFGDATVQTIWPPYDYQNIYTNENNNSVVLLIRIGERSVVLTGDAEAEVWDQIAGQIPADAVFFKVPHHGSEDATFNANHDTPWLDTLPTDCRLAASSHVRPFSHPSPSVVTELDANPFPWYRTDEHYHIEIEVFEDSADPVTVKYSHRDENQSHGHHFT